MKYLLLCIIILLIAESNEVLSQKDSVSPKERRQILNVKNSEGTEFWLCFMQNFEESDKTSNSNILLLELFITGSYDTKVRIEIDGLNFIKDTFLVGGTVNNIKINPKAMSTLKEQAERLAIHITSELPISVYGLNRRFQTTDTYLGLPVSVLGTEYRAMCYNVANKLMSEFEIIATEDSTEVMIVPTSNTYKALKGEQSKIYLKKGDVYQVFARYEPLGRCDLTGTYIKSNKKIAVFSGHQCAYVPQHIIACNHLAEQLPSVPSWGKHFYIGKLESRSKYSYRVLANEPRTKIFEDSKLVKTLNGGEFYEGTSSKEIQITADKPVLVAQYSQGFMNGDSIGDPMMLFISPTQQFLNQYRFATPVNGAWKHYVNVVVPTKAIGTMQLDGVKIDSTKFHSLGLSRYSIAYIQVPFGSHTIEGELPFGMSSYGFGFGNDAYDAYGTMGGQSFWEYEPARDTLVPKCEENKNNPSGSVIFRDDREDDTGLKRVKLIQANGADVNIPAFEEGLLQLPVDIKLKNSGTFGRALFQVEDVAFNSTLYTVCARYDSKLGRNVLDISEGENQDCVPDPGWQIGIFGKYSASFHSADFSNSGDLTSEGKFGEAFGFGGIGGFLLERQVRADLVASIRLSLEHYSGDPTAPGKVISTFDSVTGSTKPYQKERELKVDGLFMHITPAVEWFFSPHIYLLGGLNFAFNLSDAIIVKDRILLPDDFVFVENGKKEIVRESPKNLNSLKSLRLGMLCGFGVTYPIDYKFSLFGELFYTLHFGSLIDDGNWGFQQLSLQAGIKYTL
ncbi:MAG: IgGFc-binding protein [Ignavibacteriae bacterium]|nr:IgGFc-binding protein [Ignavibacteriota bacterium]